MSLLEWIGERQNPGPVGTIEGGSPPPGGCGRRAIVVRGVMAIAILIGVIVVIPRLVDDPTDRIAAGLAVMIYGIVAYRVTVRPRLDNVGWAWGLFDRPFRWSDDVNRTLVFIDVLLGPGRFVTGSLRDLARYSRGERVMVFPRDE